jgi:hypothetical protein
MARTALLARGPIYPPMNIVSRLLSIAIGRGWSDNKEISGEGNAVDVPLS